MFIHNFILFLFRLHLQAGLFASPGSVDNGKNEKINERLLNFEISFGVLSGAHCTGQQPGDIRVPGPAWRVRRL